MPDQRPRVSVVMPIYNSAEFLPQAVDWVLAQTYRDFELMLVDDGSTDGSREIAERYRAAWPDRVRCMAQSNRGSSAARNVGFWSARGDLVGLLDSDDEWLPTFLAEQVAILDAHPEVDVVTGNGFIRGGRADGRPFGPCPDPRPDPDLVEILGDETTVFIMSVFRRRVLDAVGGFDESLQTNEDYDFWIHAAMTGSRFLRNATPLGFYRRRDRSLSSSEVRMVSGVLRVYRKWLARLDERSAAHRVCAEQIARFELALLDAEARAALWRGDAAAAAEAFERLSARGGGARATVAARTLKWLPRAALWAYAARRHLIRKVATTGR